MLRRVALGHRFVYNSTEAMGKKSRKAGKGQQGRGKHFVSREERERGIADAAADDQIARKHPHIPLLWGAQGEPSSHEQDVIYNCLHERYGVDAANDVALREYTGDVVLVKLKTEGLESALKAVRRWPEIRDCWERMRPRFRRRRCNNPYCMKLAKLQAPRYLVCSACQEFSLSIYYCSEACQRADGPRHQLNCPANAFRRYWDPTWDREAMIRRCKEHISTWTRGDIQEAKYRNQLPGMNIKRQTRRF